MEKTKEATLPVTRRARRHTKAEIAARLAEYRASGLSVEAFAARAGLRPATLLSWHYRQRRQAEPRAGSAFARVQVQAARAGTLTVRWPQGMEVEVEVDLDEAGIDDMIENLQDRIDEENDRLTRKQDALTAKFARLEATMTLLRSQMAVLTGTF